MYIVSQMHSKPSYLSPTPMLYRLNVACKILQKYIYIKKFTHIQHMRKEMEVERGGNKSNKWNLIQPFIFFF